MGIVPREEARSLGALLHAEKKTVVFTNGCFDILHHGHVQYLLDAKALGDVLVVGMNTDASVRRLKGNERPVVSELDRAFVLASLRAVDHVILFDEDTPHALIGELLPDVLVKGGDWEVASIIGADIVRAHGGRVLSLPFVDGYSTTSILQKIKRL